MRSFVALVPPETVRRELKSVVEPLWSSYPALCWTDPADWHLTVTFLGEVQPSQELSAALAEVAGRTHAFPLRFAGSGHFDARVLWAGVAGATERLHDLSNAIRTAARGAGVEFDARPYRPHLTLAHAWHRGRSGEIPEEVPDVEPVVTSLSSFRGSDWIADRLLLMEVRSERTPRYAVVESWPFQL